MQQKEIMSEIEVAELLGVNLRTLQKHRAEKTLAFPYVRVGDRTLYHRQAVMNAFFKPGETETVYVETETVKTKARGRGRPRKS